MDEVAIISGALQLTSTTAQEAMTPIEETVTLCSDAVVDAALVDEVLKHGLKQVLVSRCSASRYVAWEVMREKWMDVYIDGAHACLCLLLYGLLAVIYYPVISISPSSLSIPSLSVMM